MPVLSLLLLALMIGALVDIILRPSDSVKHLPKVVWVIMVIFLPVIGSILWFLIGREYAPIVDRGSFGDPRRRETITLGRSTPNNGPSGGTYGFAQGRSTEDELAALDAEIEYHAKLDRERKLAAELEQRRNGAGGSSPSSMA